ncbi:glycosyltransferase family 9 protein [Micromonospora sp. NPDC049559]|uniref:glycosyltransferase family 9 protein n=1 Tax=Micromonospora sp. NPDC049559 TaxID=3155923 RepID=UPI00343F044A
MILVLRALGVGDLVTAVPALRGLRAAFPERTLALAAPRWLAPLVDLVGGVDHLVPTEGLEAAGRPVTGGGERGRDAPGAGAGGLPAAYWAVNLHGRGPQSHRLLQAAAPERLCAFACADAEHHDGPRWDPTEHEVRRWCRLLDWYGVETDPEDLGLARPSPHRVPVGVTVVHPGAKTPEKRWPAERFAAVARELARSGHRVVVTGSRPERELVERVARDAGLPGTAVVAGRLDLAGLAALVAHGRMLVSADTGVAHLATAYGIPSVVLFGPVSPAQWGPPPDRPWHRALWAGETGPGGSPGNTGSPVEDGLPDGVVGPGVDPAAIGVAEVLDATDEVERAGRERGAVAA